MNYFSYFPNCPLVEGASYSAFYDLRNSAIIRFPSQLLPRLHALRDADRATIDSSVHYPELAELAETLIDLGVASYTSRRSPWIEIGKYEAESLPTHALVDVGPRHHNYPALFATLGDVGCEFIQIRFFELPLHDQEIRLIAEAARHASLRGVEIIAPFVGLEVLSWLALSLKESPQISGITLHSASPSARSNDVQLETGQHIRFQTKRLGSSEDCGRISQESICAPTVSSFRRLQVSNGCHAGKVGIDVNGHIRNCPASKHSFGLISETELGDVVRSASFQSTWWVTKDAIEGCKDCEFRYACTDCRAFTAGDDVKTAKPAKCGYDPYVGAWKHNDRR